MNNTKSWSKNLKVRDNFEDQGVERITTEWIIEKQVGNLWTGFSWLRTGTNKRFL
jgi:hypothetical protein